MLALPRKQLDSFLGAAGGAGAEAARLSREAVVAALRKLPALAGASDAALAAMADSAQPARYRRGELVAVAGEQQQAAGQQLVQPNGQVTGAGSSTLFLVRCGEVLLLLPAAAQVPNGSQQDVEALRVSGRGGREGGRLRGRQGGRLSGRHRKGG